MYLYRKLVSTKVDNSNDNHLESGINQLLKQLQQVNMQMQAWVSSGGSEIFSHTLTRHQEILQDLTQEFNRLHSSHRAKKEHASLLEDFREFDRTRLDLQDGNGSYIDQALIKERATVHRSTGQVKTVRVRNVSMGASEQDIKEFFSFSGIIEYVEMKRCPVPESPAAVAQRALLRWGQRL